MFASKQRTQSGGFLNFVTGSLAASLETFFRRDMGERYYTPANVIFAGLMLMLFALIGSIVGALFRWGMDAAIGQRSATPGLDYGHAVIGLLPLLVLLVFTVLAAVHLARQRATFRLGTQEFSYYAGDSNLAFLAPAVMPLLNALAKGLIKATGRFWMDEEERERMDELNPVFEDERLVTVMVIEPVVGLGLVWFFWSVIGSAALGFWLLLAVPATLLHSFQTHRNTRYKILDLKDSEIEGQFSGAIMDSQRYRELERMQAQEEAAPPSPLPEPVHFSEVYPGKTDTAAALAAIGAQMRGGQPAGDETKTQSGKA